MNSAVALGTLGADAQFLGRLSDDAFGRQLRAHIVEAGVQPGPGHGVVPGHLDRRGQPGRAGCGELHVPLQRHRELRLAARGPAGARRRRLAAHRVAVLRREPGRRGPARLDAAVRSGVSYDINVRPTVITDPAVYWARVQPWLQAVGRRDGIVKASDEDIEFLARAAGGLRPGRDRRRLGRAVRARAGRRSPWAPTAAWPCEPGGGVTGAGLPDRRRRHGRGGGHVHGRLPRGQVKRGLPLEDSLRRGAAAAVIVCSRQGAQPPTSAEVDALLARGA